MRNMLKTFLSWFKSLYQKSNNEKINEEYESVIFSGFEDTDEIDDYMFSYFALEEEEEFIDNIEWDNIEVEKDLITQYMSDTNIEYTIKGDGNELR